MSKIAVCTGPIGDQTAIVVEWFDHNNTRHHSEIEVVILDQDKPRTLEIRVDGAVVSRISAENNGGLRVHRSALGCGEVDFLFPPVRRRS